MIRLLIVLAICTSTLGLAGCFNATPDDTAVPWSRPADWERGAPGF
ncbi:MAG: hypothetical protein AAF065_02700 [Verrucomicrobiota bacterium]